MFKDAKDDVEQFAHDCANDDLFGFAFFPQPLGEGFEDGVVLDRHQCRHIERFAQDRIADLG